MTFRFILQPIMAAIAALYDGVKDARTGRSPYLWTIFSNPEKRVGRLREGLISTARIILLGLCMDLIYQFIVFKTFHPAEAVITALALAFVPYLLLRGPCARIARWWRGDAHATKSISAEYQMTWSDGMLSPSLCAPFSANNKRQTYGPLGVTVMCQVQLTRTAELGF